MTRPGQWPPQGYTPPGAGDDGMRHDITSYDVNQTFKLRISKEDDVTIYARYDLTIHGPEFQVEQPGSIESGIVQTTLDGKVLRDAEHLITDALPGDWHAEIRDVQDAPT